VIVGGQSQINDHRAEGQQFHGPYLSEGTGLKGEGDRAELQGRIWSLEHEGGRTIQTKKLLSPAVGSGGGSGWGEKPGEGETGKTKAHDKMARNGGERPGLGKRLLLLIEV